MTAPVSTASVSTAPVSTAPVSTALVSTTSVSTASVSTASVSTASVSTASVSTAPVSTASASASPRSRFASFRLRQLLHIRLVPLAFGFVTSPSPAFFCFASRPCSIPFIASLASLFAAPLFSSLSLLA